jgi:hypothetical protein
MFFINIVLRANAQAHKNGVAIGGTSMRYVNFVLPILALFSSRAFAAGGVSSCCDNPPPAALGIEYQCEADLYFSATPIENIELAARYEASKLVKLDKMNGSERICFADSDWRHHQIGSPQENVPAEWLAGYCLRIISGAFSPPGALQLESAFKVGASTVRNLSKAEFPLLDPAAAARELAHRTELEVESWKGWNRVLSRFSLKCSLKEK